MSLNQLGIGPLEIITIVLVVVLGFAFFAMTRKQKKEALARAEVVNEIKVGDRVKTQLGVYGKILKITETTDGKIAILETGDSECGALSTIEVHLHLVNAIDTKCELKYDEDGKRFKKENGEWVEDIEYNEGVNMYEEETETNEEEVAEEKTNEEQESSKQNT